MIYSRLQGGIGNILWQTTAIQSLAWRNNDDITLLTDIVDNQYACDGGHKGLPAHYINTLLKDYTITQNHKLHAHKEQTQFTYNIQYKPNTAYFGYWQHINYISSFKNELKQKLHLDTTNAIDFMDRYDLSVDNTVVVHIRRGDYVRLKWGVRDNYYQDAMKHFDGLNFIFVSNDMKWCEETFPNQYYSDMKTDLDDLALINLCNKRIICNSTFSWWAAYLGDNEKTICPSYWLQKKKLSNNLLLDEWVKI